MTRPYRMRLPPSAIRGLNGIRSKKKRKGTIQFRIPNLEHCIRAYAKNQNAERGILESLRSFRKTDHVAGFSF
jgi:hypothetical protein